MVSKPEGNRQAAGARYKIGAVERLTGIPASSIRIWERRHGAVQPERSESGTRYYSDEDVGRLRLIRELTDAGDAISEVATLALDQLQARRRAFEARGPGAGLQSVLLVGPFETALRTQIEAALGADAVRCVPDASAVLDGHATGELVVLAQATLHRDAIAGLHALRRRAGAELLLVVYRFAAEDVLQALRAPEVVTLRAPLQWSELQNYLQWPQQQAPAMGLDDLLSRPRSAAHFTPEQLARVAAMESAVQCECPHHLASLIADLQAFEQYSAECESRGAEDARLHARLHRGTALCRDVMERLLQDVLLAEGLEL